METNNLFILGLRNVSFQSMQTFSSFRAMICSTKRYFSIFLKCLFTKIFTKNRHFCHFLLFYLYLHERYCHKLFIQNQNDLLCSYPTVFLLKYRFKYSFHYLLMWKMSTFWNLNNIHDSGIFNITHCKSHFHI